MVFLSGHAGMNGGAIGRATLEIAAAKCTLPFWEAFFRGALCNVLVCMAVWMTFAGRSVADKLVAIVFPISAFVAAGFEHSIANMYLLPYALVLKACASPEFWAAIGQEASAYPALTVANALRNIAVTTLGNLVGGSLLVGAVYWFVYLRRRPAATAPPP